MSFKIAWSIVISAIFIIYPRILSRLSSSTSHANELLCFLASIKGKADLAAAHMRTFSNGAVSATVVSHKTVKHSFVSFIRNRRNMVLLLGTAGSWFLLNYAYYGNTISTPLVLKSVAPGAQLIQSIALLTSILPEPAGKSLEEVSREETSTHALRPAAKLAYSRA